MRGTFGNRPFLHTRRDMISYVAFNLGAVLDGVHNTFKGVLGKILPHGSFIKNIFSEDIGTSIGFGNWKGHSVKSFLDGMKS